MDDVVHTLKTPLKVSFSLYPSFWCLLYSAKNNKQYHKNTVITWRHAIICLLYFWADDILIHPILPYCQGYNMTLRDSGRQAIEQNIAQCKLILNFKLVFIQTTRSTLFVHSLEAQTPSSDVVCVFTEPLHRRRRRAQKAEQRQPCVESCYVAPLIRVLRLS